MSMCLPEHQSLTPCLRAWRPCLPLSSLACACTILIMLAVEAMLHTRVAMSEARI